MATLYDVAKLAGVSKTLVSRFINNKPGVSEKSKKAIAKAMKELNYTPNELARSLVLQKTSTIGVILDSLCEPYFFELINGIEHEITRSDYKVIFCSGRNSLALKNQYMDFFSSGRTDGVIIYGSGMANNEDSVFRERAHLNFPTVVVEYELEDPVFSNVVIQNAYGSKLAIEHLVERGCQDIVHVSGSTKVRAAVDRKNGYIEAMKSKGLQKYIQVVECEDFGVEYGYNAVMKMLKSRVLPDAIYFGADNTAYGGLQALEEKKIKVPEDIKVIGFDDDEPNHYTLPFRPIPLTTIRQPLFEVGKKAVDVLIHQINNPKEAKQKVLITPQLIERESTM